MDKIKIEQLDSYNSGFYLSDLSGRQKTPGTVKMIISDKKVKKVPRHDKNYRCIFRSE